MSDVRDREQTVIAPTRLGLPDVTWYWIEPHGDRPGWWTDDDIEAKHQRGAGRLVLTAVDGRIEGVAGCAHRADVRWLSARVQRLESIVASLLNQLQETGELADQLHQDLPDRTDGTDRSIPDDLEGLL